MEKKTISILSEYDYWPIIEAKNYEKGIKENSVRYIQAALHSEGCLKTLEFTDEYDDITFDAVKTFQAKYHLVVDGIVGKQTISKMKELNLICLDQEEHVNIENTMISSSNYIHRGTRIRFGEYISWSQVQKTIKLGTVIHIKDFYSGIEFDAMAGHGHNHADIEPLTKNDSTQMKLAWGGEYSWLRRPVLVFVDERVFAASLNGMPHAGIDSEPALEIVNNRSAGYGRGKNYDLVKGNGMDGHICLHFKDSMLHTGDKVDADHQKCVKIAAGVE